MQQPSLQPKHRLTACGHSHELCFNQSALRAQSDAGVTAWKHHPKLHSKNCSSAWNQATERTTYSPPISGLKTNISVTEPWTLQNMSKHCQLLKTEIHSDTTAECHTYDPKCLCYTSEKKEKKKNEKKKWVYGFFITLGKHLCALSEIDIPSAPPSYRKTRKIHLRFGTSSIIYLTEALNWKGAVIAHQGYRKQELLAEGFQSKKPILSPTQNGHFDFSVLQTTFNQKGSFPSNVTHYSLSKTQKWEEFCIGK